MPLARASPFSVSEGREVFRKARFADMAFARDLLSAQAAEEILPLYFAGLRRSGCEMSADTRYAHAKYRPCRATSREALNVAWLSRCRIMVSCAEFPQSSPRRNTSIFQLVNTFRAQRRPPRPATAPDGREYALNFEEDRHGNPRPQNDER